MSREFEIRQKIDAICNQFEENWSETSSSEFESILNQVDPEMREPLLRALLEVDFELRNKAGLQIDPNDYRQLGDDAVANVEELIATAHSPNRRETTTDSAPNKGASSSQQIGPYKLLQQIGEGGMGTVWMAEQEKPVRRRVALKVIKAGLDSKQVIARFEAERQALSMMDHQNIARVLDAGATDSGQPYFVMELVQGIPINQYCNQHKLSINERLELFIPICQAVQHAHQKGIIHRDLKPSNVLVCLYDGKPVPKVIDFGLAKALQHQSKLTDKTLFTEFGQVVGTLQYMSPEQAEMNQLDIDTRTDIYSLGAMLYELLTGSTPIETDTLKKNAILQVLETIREQDPPPPSARLSSSSHDVVSGISEQRKIEPHKLKNILRGELDWVVMKALDKDRTRRYETANGLAVEIQRYLSGDPVQARPPSRSYLMRKYVRKNKGLVSALGAIAAALLIGAVGFAWQASIATDQRDIAINAQKAEKARADELKLVSDFQARMLEQVDPTEAGIRLTWDVNERFAAALEKANVPEGERQPRSDAFRQEWLHVNATDAAVALIDETILKPAVKAVAEQFQDQPLIDAQLRQVLAERYRNLGLYEEALPLQTAALATRQRLLGEADPITLNSVAEMGILLEEQGKLAEAEPYYIEALEESRRVLGEEHPDTITAINNMGLLFQVQGKFAEAETHYREALEKRRRLLGDEHPETLIITNNLGLLQQHRGNLNGAELLLREASEKRRQVLGDSDKDTIVSINNFIGLLIAQGKLAQAEPLMRESLDKIRSVLGEDHPNTLIFINNLGYLLQQQGKLTEASPLLQEALDKNRRILGDEHPQTLFSINNMGLLLYSQGKFAEAETYFNELLTRRRHVLGNDHLDTLVSINNMAKVLEAQGKFNDAELFLREALKTSRHVLGDENPQTLIFMDNLGLLWEREGKVAEAEPLLCEALEKRRLLLGEEHRDTLTSMANMGRLYRTQGELEKAEPVIREVLEKRRVVLGEEHQDTLISISNLGDVMMAQGNLIEAEPLFREALEKSQRHLGTEHLLSLIFTINLGSLLEHQGKHRESFDLLSPIESLARRAVAGANVRQFALLLTTLGRAHVGLGYDPERFKLAEANLLEAHPIYIQTRGETHKDTLECVQGLVDLYTAWHVAEPNKGYGAKAAEWKIKLSNSSTEPENK